MHKTNLWHTTNFANLVDFVYHYFLEGLLSIVSSLIQDEDKDEGKEKKDEKKEKEDKKDKDKDEKRAGSVEKKAATGTKEEETKKEPEPNFEILSNPARIMKPQVCMVLREAGRR